MIVGTLLHLPGPQLSHRRERWYWNHVSLVTCNAVVRVRRVRMYKCASHLRSAVWIQVIFFGVFIFSLPSLQRSLMEAAFSRPPVGTFERLTYSIPVSGPPCMIVHAGHCTRLPSQENRWELNSGSCSVHCKPWCRKAGGPFSNSYWSMLGLGRLWQWHVFTFHRSRVKRSKDEFPVLLFIACQP